MSVSVAKEERHIPSRAASGSVVPAGGVPYGVQAFEQVYRSVTERENDPEAKKNRDAAFQRFRESGLPTPKNEDWKYTNLQALGRVTFRPATAEKAPSSSELDALLGAIDTQATDACRLVFVNGVYDAALSKVGSIEMSDLPAPAIDGSEDGTVSPLLSLNAALATSGKLIRIPAGRAIRPLIQVLHVVTSDEEDLLVPSRLCIIAESRSEAQVVEYFTGPAGRRYFSSVATDVVCKAGARLEHTKVQDESTSAFHIANLTVRQEAESVFTSNVFSFGGALVRNEIAPVLDGERIECFLNGLTVIESSQHVDNSTVIDHAKPNCFSRELYKGVYGGKSRGVFSGTIIVRPHAQKTNAIQSNKSVLLSDSASVETRPQLKIWADDVKCTHGATVGQLDEDARFYLRSRGIDAAQAQVMLLQAFAGDIALHVTSPQLRSVLEAKLSHRLEMASSPTVE